MLQRSMREMKEHADKLLDNILNHPNLTEPQINQMPAFQKDDLRRRVKIADDVSSASEHLPAEFFIPCLSCC